MRPHGQGRNRVVQCRRQREGHDFDVETTCLDLREVQDVVDHREQRLGRSADGLDVVTLHRRQVGLEREFGHAQHAIHRRPDLVAHVGQELALVPVGRLGAVLGVAQFGGAERHRLLQAVAVSANLAIQRANLAQHVVEGGDEHADLVGAGDGRQGDVEATRSADFRGCFRQLPQGRDDGTLEQCAQAPGQGERHHEDGAEDDQHAACSRVSSMRRSATTSSRPTQPPSLQMSRTTRMVRASNTVPGQGCRRRAARLRPTLRCIADGTAVACRRGPRRARRRGPPATRASPGRHRASAKVKAASLLVATSRVVASSSLASCCTGRPRVVGHQAGPGQGQAAGAGRNENQRQPMTEGKAEGHAGSTCSPGYRPAADSRVKRRTAGLANRPARADCDRHPGLARTTARAPYFPSPQQISCPRRCCWPLLVGGNPDGSAPTTSASGSSRPR